ncbi:MAG: tRNA pseudouridine(55) synthase TruB [Arenicellales bacterium]|nr:tRNA pseudouridine(55) synthase TruB [Arenicellales bacterium]MDP7155852.1 tRNA pseudouridine(55) synthase TruB [Arenicellales bacterium]MDP7283579.1 tRNA pseudouridine(55) synthase TruB [Arenicellales bacterium]MDP7481638.1 tRNA pseudouridine(55) synthase TruB [Arenicellales bacterium]
MGRRKRRGDKVNGMLLLDKPVGITSNGALQDVKQLMNAAKAGHTGSLDPIATGLLPLCFGETTKLSGYLLELEKRYWTRIRLGQSTETGDSEGAIVQTRAVELNQDRIEAALEHFRGTFDQIPPMYSAIKVNGQPLYKLARQGIEIERKPRQVTVYNLELAAFDGVDLELELECSSGFYVRALAYDLGAALGCGGHVTALRRLSVGDLDIADAVTLDQLKECGTAIERRKMLIKGEEGLAHLPRVDLSVDAAFYLCRGQDVRADGLPQEGMVRLFSSDSGFIGIGQITDDHRVGPKRLFVER